MLKGIDISTHNVIANYITAAKSIDFALIKATQGYSVSDNGKYYLFTDSKFKTHMNGFYGSNVDIGVYHYLTANNVQTAREEAEYFCKVIEPYRDRINLWAIVDVEEKKYIPLNNRALLTTIVTAFCQVVESKGFRSMVYTNPDFLTHHMVNIPQYDLWLALWRDVSRVPSIETYPNMKVWQYGLTKINGIFDDVDGNLGFYETESESMLKDRPSGWAEKDWKFATEQGITDGTRPHDPITREEVVVMILRALGVAESTLKGEMKK